MVKVMLKLDGNISVCRVSAKPNELLRLRRLSESQFLHYENTPIQIQSTLVISNSKGLSETLRDIRSSTYQIYGTEEKTINRTTTFNRMNT